jgi:hypothetical protein
LEYKQDATAASSEARWLGALFIVEVFRIPVEADCTKNQRYKHLKNQLVGRSDTEEPLEGDEGCHGRDKPSGPRINPVPEL